jgi:hypothetical protein
MTVIFATMPMMTATSHRGMVARSLVRTSLLLADIDNHGGDHGGDQGGDGWHGDDDDPQGDDTNPIGGLEKTATRRGTAGQVPRARTQFQRDFFGVRDA